MAAQGDTPTQAVFYPPAGESRKKSMETPQQASVIARFDQVALRYGQGPEILRDICLELPAGSFHFLVGRSGAGKTSLLRLVYVALRPSAGRLELFGADVGRASRAELPALRRRIGIVFQDFRLLPELTLYDNVALPLRLAGCSEEEISRNTTQLLGRMGLNVLARSRPPSLSGGQQQLAAIARAVIARPRLLIADEPTASVDEALALRLIRLFQDLNRLGTTVLIATHNERLAERFRQPRLRLRDGRLTRDAGRRSNGTAEPADVGRRGTEVEVA
jgi:cell division transport system ATP-binding protein